MNDREGPNTEAEPASYFTLTAAESWGIEQHCSPHSQFSLIQLYQILNPAITSPFCHALAHAGVEGPLITMKATFVHALNRPLAVYGKLQPHLLSSLLPQQPKGSSHFKRDIMCSLLNLHFSDCNSLCVKCMPRTLGRCLFGCMILMWNISSWADSCNVKVCGGGELITAWQPETSSSTAGLMRQATRAI